MGPLFALYSLYQMAVITCPCKHLSLDPETLRKILTPQEVCRNSATTNFVIYTPSHTHVVSSHTHIAIYGNDRFRKKFKTRYIDSSPLLIYILCETINNLPEFLKGNSNDDIGKNFIKKHSSPNEPNQCCKVYYECQRFERFIDCFTILTVK